MKSKFIIFGAVCVAFTATPSMAAELVTNGGFETGSFSGFTVEGTGFSGVFFNGGSAGDLQFFRAAFANGPVTLSQDVNTVAGQNYNFGFTNQVDGGGIINSFAAFFGGQSVYSQSNITTGMNFTPRSFGVTATSDLTRLSFTFASAGGFQNFDNVTLTTAAAVPEPGTWAMMLLGFGFVGGAMRSAKRRQKLSVSYA